MTQLVNNPQELTQRNAEKAGAIYKPPYWSVLREPTASLAGNPNDRPDVATAAILGYN